MAYHGAPRATVSVSMLHLLMGFVFVLRLGDRIKAKTSFSQRELTMTGIRTHVLTRDCEPSALPLTYFAILFIEIHCM